MIAAHIQHQCTNSAAAIRSLPVSIEIFTVVGRQKLGFKEGRANVR